MWCIFWAGDAIYQFVRKKAWQEMTNGPLGHFQQRSSTWHFLIINTKYENITMVVSWAPFIVSFWNFLGDFLFSMLLFNSKNLAKREPFVILSLGKFRKRKIKLDCQLECNSYSSIVDDIHAGVFTNTIQFCTIIRHRNSAL